MTTSIASDGQWLVAVAQDAAGREASVSLRAQPSGRRSPLRRILGLVDDVVLLLLVILLVPLVILLIGTPLALGVRLLTELAKRW